MICESCAKNKTCKAWIKAMIGGLLTGTDREIVSCSEFGKVVSK